MRIIIIGGAGFIGINAAYYFLNKGHEVIIVDNLSRPGSDYNINRLLEKHKISFINCDIRDFASLSKIFINNANIDSVLLLAGQVAVTTSVTNPREDFEINALGTFNVLESIRLSEQNPLIIYSSTNKVYGKMDDLAVSLNGKRYCYDEMESGINENRQLDFYSPYGCSKGAGEQYVRDYSRIYNMKTTVFRQSCIYGPNQFGIEDQGWVAWFTIATLLKKKFTIYGDGNQIRDVLFVDDLVKLYELAMKNTNICSGEIYNVGGGIENTLSLNELVDILAIRFSTTLVPSKDDWRPGDQKVYISDVNKISKALGWKPKTDIHEGINKMAEWIEENNEIIKFHVFENKK